MKKLGNERKTEVVGGLGWQWKCLTTSHEQKYPGHKTTVFAV